MQGLVGLNVAQVNTIKQPVKLLAREGDHAGTEEGWPFKSLFFQSLEPEAKTAVLPVENFDSVAIAIGEDEERAGEGIERELGLDHRGQAVDAFSEIHRSGTQIDAGEAIGWTSH